MSFNQMHFIIIKGQNSFRSDLERTKRRERRRNRKKTECTLAYINSWWRNGTFQMIPQYPYIRIYFLRLLYCVLGTHAKGDKVSTPNESKSWSVSTRIQKEAHTHTHTHEQANESEYGAIKRVKYLKLGQGYYINTFHLFKSRDGT